MSSNWLVFNRREVPIIMSIGGNKVSFAPHERKRFDDTDDSVIETFFGVTANWVCIKLSASEVVASQPTIVSEVVEPIKTIVEKPKVETPTPPTIDPSQPVKRKAGRPKGSGVKVK